MFITEASGKVGTLQQGYGSRNVSSLAIVVALHATLGAALLLGVARTALTTPAPPRPITVLPDVRPEKTIERLREFEQSRRHHLTTFVDLPVLPPITDAAPVISQPPVDSNMRSNTASTEPLRGTPAVPAIATPSREVGVACPNAREVQGSMRYPAEARREGVAGDVVARFVVGANGTIRDVVIASSSNRLFNREVLNAVASFRCQGQGQDVLVEAPFTFRLE
jgi:periplasmic protein TonB